MKKQNFLLVWVLVVVMQSLSVKAELQISELKRQWQHDRGVWSVAFSPDSRLLASGSMDNTVKVWNVASGQLLYTLNHQNSVKSVVFSPNGKWLVSGSLDNTVKVWNVALGQLHYALKHEDNVYSIAFSPDGKWLASGGGKTVKFWNVVSGQLLYTFKHEKGGIKSIAFSPDGKWLASAAGKTLIVWDMTSKQLQHTLEKLEDNPSLTAISAGYPLIICAVTFSPNGNWLVSSASCGNEDA